MKKKSILLFISVFALSHSFAQWTISGSDIHNSNSGNVGIGITTPSSKLHVKTLMSSGTTGLKAGHFEAESSTSGTNGLVGMQGVCNFTHTSGTANLMIGVSGITFHNGSGNITSMRGMQSNVSIWGSGNVTDAFAFMGAIGSAGTGTITNGYGLFINPLASQIVNKWGVYVNDPIAKNYFGGAVTIGTTSDFGYKLAVNGNAIFTEAKVKLHANWPDYVFRKNYKLLSLNDLEKYIQANNHLPNIPSAEKIKENGGFELGDMTTRLLEKVEELTLYIIQLKKENEQIKHELQNLSSKK